MVSVWKSFTCLLQQLLQSNLGMDWIFVLTEKSFFAEKGLSGLQIFSHF